MNGRPLRGLACLVLAHDNAAQLALLLAHLSRDGARCLVHLDARARATRRDLAAQGVPPGARLLAAEDCVAADWGGFGIVEATLALMREALRDPDTRRLCLLSGAHLPVRPAAEIAAFLADDRERIDLRFACAEPPDAESLRRFWYRTLPGRESDSALLRLVNRHAWLLGKRDLARALRGMTPMVGGQWWCLTADCARHVLEFVDANPWYVRFFRGAHIPDESFFHTIIGASPHAERLGAPPTWQVMEGYSPAVIRADMLPAALASGLPFARKFDMRLDPVAVNLALAAGDAAAPAGPERERRDV